MTNPPSATPATSRVEFIALAAALMALNALAIDVVLPALPYLGDALAVTNPNERQLVIGAYMIGFGAAQLVFGPISDRFGRRSPLFIGIAVYVACAVAAVFAPSFATLLALRFFQGLGAAATRVITTSMVRDRFAGREMASVMSLVFMVFMAMPIIAPGVGQAILLVASWHIIFAFMAILASAIGIWAFIRLPETLHPQFRRPLTLNAITGGFALVLGNRVAFFYGLAGMFLFAALFGFIISTQQIFVGIYGLGTWFPLAFAAMAGVMALSSFVNSRIVQRFGMRRISHMAMAVYVLAAGLLLILALLGPVPFWTFYGLILLLQFAFSSAASNMNALSMEPLGVVAGTAAAVFGFMQTVAGALLGTFIGQQFNGTLIPNAAGCLTMGTLVFAAILIGEKGRLFGMGREYAATPATAD